METRVERDSLGELRVPRRAYWGIRTGRRLARGVLGQRYPRRLIHGVSALVRAITMAMEDAEVLRVDEGEWVSAAAQELSDAMLDAEVVVDAATDWNGEDLVLNVREVVKNRANELMGGDVGVNQPISLERHVTPRINPAGVFRLGALVGAAILVRDELLSRLDGEAHQAAEALLAELVLIDSSALGVDPGEGKQILRRLSGILGVEFRAGSPAPLTPSLNALVGALPNGAAATASQALAAAYGAAFTACPGASGVWAPLLVRGLEAAARA